MKIHTLKHNENLSDIAKNYDTEKEIILRDNELEHTAAIGENLLIRKPTRTYKVKYGDTLSKLAIRFGLNKYDVLALNPHICEKEIKPGNILSLKQCANKYGNAISNGYYYRGCTNAQLERALPYLTYVTIAAAIIKDKKIQMSFDTEEPMKFVSSKGKIPLLRFHLQNDELSEIPIFSIMETVEKNGFLGAVFPMQGRGKEHTSELSEIQKKFREKNLFFIIEADEETSPTLIDMADACFFSFYKIADDKPKSFEAAEHALYEKLFSDGYSKKILVEIPAIAKIGNEFVSILEALRLARKSKREIKTDESLLSFFSSGHEDVCFASLQNIKATLEHIGEYGFMGACFDIMRSPVNHFLMYNELFNTVTNHPVSSRQGCIREQK